MKQLQKPQQEWFVHSLPEATILNTTSLTPVDFCKSVPFSHVQNFLRDRFETAAQSLPPLSVRSMADLIWDIGYNLHEFPEYAGTIIVQNHQSFALVFGYANIEGSQDHAENYMDPDYQESLSDYLGAIATLDVNGIKVDLDNYAITFKDKAAMFKLVCTMVDEEGDDLFHAFLPEETSLGIPEEVENNEEGPFNLARQDRCRDESGIDFQDAEKREVTLEDEQGCLLYMSPYKPYLSRSHYTGQASMALDAPVKISLGQIYEFLLREGETGIPRPEIAQKEYYSYGLN